MMQGIEGSVSMDFGHTNPITMDTSLYDLGANDFMSHDGPNSHLPPFSAVFSPSHGSSPPHPPTTPGSDSCMESDEDPPIYYDLRPITNDIILPKSEDIFDKIPNVSGSMDSWKYKIPEEWGSREILDWLYYMLPQVSAMHGISDVDCTGENFSELDGKHLISLTEKEFAELEPTFGHTYYNLLKKLVKESQFVMESYESPNEDLLLALTQEHEDYLRNPPQYDFDEKTFREDDIDKGYESTSSAEENLHVPTTVLSCDVNDNIDATLASQLPGNRNQLTGYIPGHRPMDISNMVPVGNTQRARGPSDSSTEGPPPVKRRGRKLGQVSNKGNHLWEFIRDLLKDPATNPSLIRWEDEEDGVFRIVNSKRVSELWGKKKNNPHMNYEKLSRAMRHYYKSKILEAVLGRRLVYRFGVNSFGWQKPKTAQVLPSL